MIALVASGFDVPHASMNSLPVCPIPMSEPLRVRRLNETDANSIAEFMRAAEWDAGATSDSVLKGMQTAASENPFEPGKGPPAVGVFVGSRLVAYLNSIPTRFWNGTAFAAGHWLKGFWVLEQYRDGLVGYLLLKEMLKHVGLAASMPAALVPRRLSAALGMRDLGALRNYIEPLRPGRILRKLDSKVFDLNGIPTAASVALRFAKIPPFIYVVDAMITACLTALRLPSTLAGRALTTQIGERLPSEADLDSLWDRAQRTAACCATRSGAYLRWRYACDGDGRYWFASVWHREALVALAVLQRPQRLDDPRLAGLGIGSVVDLVIDPRCPGALPRVLRAARRWANFARYDALLLTASHRALRRPLLRAGYIPMPGNIHLMLRDRSGEHGLSTDLDTWMVTRGDAWSDHL